MDERKLGRARALRRFPARPCEVCGVARTGPGRAGAIHRHHRDGDQSNNDPANIAFLCSRDHDDAHAALKAAGIDVDRGGGPRPRIAALFRDRAIERASEASRLRALGRSTSEIAIAMGVDRWTVIRWSRKYPAA